MKIVSVVGARPQFVKLAALHRVLSQSVNHTIIHTGQHYDPMLSDIFFSDLEIPQPKVNLSAGSGSHASQTASIIAALEPVLEKLDPTWLVVFGDTNSTIAASLVGAKLGLRVAHLEAGLRSFNRAMPEEVNRVLTDHASDLCLAPSVTAIGNLEKEGLLDRSVMVGDVMVDVLYDTLNKLDIPLDSQKGQKGSTLWRLFTVKKIRTTKVSFARFLRRLTRCPVPSVCSPTLVFASEWGVFPSTRWSIPMSDSLSRLRTPLSFAKLQTLREF